MSEAHLAAALAVATRLTRKGARLVPTANGYKISQRGDVLDPTASSAETIDRATVQAALDRAWLVIEQDGRLRLTQAGAVALRRGSDYPVLRSELSSLKRARTRTSAREAAPPHTLLARLSAHRDASGAPLITQAQREAGERLARDFVHGQMQPRVTANWDRLALGFAMVKGTGPGAESIPDGVSGAQERVRRALANAGPEFADLLIDVCCLEIGLETIEHRRSWPARTARIVLGLALDRLARHYGIVATGPPRGTIKTWQGEQAASQ